MPSNKKRTGHHCIGGLCLLACDVGDFSVTHYTASLSLGLWPPLPLLQLSKPLSTPLPLLEAVLIPLLTPTLPEALGD